MLHTIRKPLAHAVAFTMYNPENMAEFLIVKRPPTAEDHPNMWGFPATMLKPGELPEKGLKRAGKEKLGVIMEPVEFTGAIAQERKNFILYLMHFKTVLKKGKPDVKKATAKGTRYTDQKLTSNPKDLFPIGEKGSICVQLFLHKEGFWPREKFIYKLEV